MGTLGWPQILIIAVIIILLFGSRKLPDLARGLGSSLGIFRGETKGMMEDDKKSSEKNTSSDEQPRAVADTLVGRVDLGAPGDEEPRHIRVAVAGGPVERRPAARLAKVKVGPVREQQPDDRRPAMAGGERERGVATCGSRVDLGTVSQQRLGSRRVAVPGRKVKRCLRDLVPRIRLGSPG